MKTLTLSTMLALTAASGTLVIAAEPAMAQAPWYEVARGNTGVTPYIATGPAWVNIARQNPAPAYQPYRGYSGAKTYVGQHYPRGYSRRGSYYRPYVHRSHRSAKRARAIGAALALIAILAQR